MITQEHLEHWIKEIRYQLNGIRNEVSSTRLTVKGIQVGAVFVSFEYLEEKAGTIEGTIRCIEDDIKND